MAKKSHRETLLLKYGVITFIFVVAFITAFQIVTTQLTKKPIADIYLESVDSYMNQFICISNEDESVYMYVNKIDKYTSFARFHGPGFESFSSSWMYIFPERSEEIYYEKMKTHLKIITKEQFYKEFDNAVASSKESLERECLGF